MVLNNRISKLLELKSLFRFIFSLIPIILLTLFLNSSSPCWAGTYYVDAVNGNDANTGTSRNSSLKTIQSAANKTLPGDICLVLTGSYYERVHITQSGAPGQPIVYQAEGTVINRGFTIDASYIHIVGFENNRHP